MQLSQKKKQKTTKTSLLKDKEVFQINLCFRFDNNIIKSASKNRKSNNTFQECEGDR